MGVVWRGWGWRSGAAGGAMALALGVAACASGDTRPANAPDAHHAAAAPALPTVVIPGVPHVVQKPDFCGEADVAMFLRWRGVPATQDQVFDLSGMDPARGMGVTTRELATALRALGVDPGPVWSSVRADDAPAELEARFAELVADLSRGVPSIVCTHFDERPDTTEHFRLVLGYDAAHDEVVYNDPALERGAYLRMARARFLSLWPLKYDAARWTVIRLALDAKQLRAPPSAPGYSPADYAQHVMKLRARLPRGFSLVVAPPFVVVGDGGAPAVQASATQVVEWAVDRLKRSYFDRDPSRILDVWLFKDKASYDDHTRSLFGDTPDTPYGYYSSAHGALIMNIATGGGTLVHEIVHPFIETNFPGCPAWFNEGLGSLYEQSADRGGRIVGLTNWRLAGLQRALRRSRVPSFRTLLSTTDDDFYNRDQGTNYAQARYLLYYLQERGLLERYYKAFHANRAADPSGYATLMNVLGNPDPDAFRQGWERFVMGLGFPG